MNYNYQFKSGQQVSVDGKIGEIIGREGGNAIEVDVNDRTKMRHIEGIRYLVYFPKTYEKGWYFENQLTAITEAAPEIPPAEDSGRSKIKV